MAFQEASLYIHIPFCAKRCFYCDFFSSVCPEKHVPENYVQALANEIKCLSESFGIDSWKTVYIGGGTPSLLSPEELCFLCTEIKNAASFAEDYEFTIEMNPQDITGEFLCTAEENGANRLSIGLQSFNDRTLQAIGRRTRKEDNEKALDLVKKFWHKALSLDLIAGLPFQTKDDLEADIEKAEATGAEHISLYSLSVEDGTVLEKLIDEGKLPYDSDESDDFWIHARNLLKEKGFLQYEISNFCRNGKKSMHNSNYWKMETYFACGSGGTGTVFSGNSGKDFRWTNTKNIEKYIDFWKNPRHFSSPEEYLYQIPSEKEEIERTTSEFEYLMMNFRTSEGCSEKSYEKRFEKRLEDRLKEKSIFFKWLEEGLSGIRKTENDRFFYLTENGLLFLNRFLETL